MTKSDTFFNRLRYPMWMIIGDEPPKFYVRRFGRFIRVPRKYADWRGKRFPD